MTVPSAPFFFIVTKYVSETQTAESFLQPHLCFVPVELSLGFFRLYRCVVFWPSLRNITTLDNLYEQACGSRCSQESCRHNSQWSHDSESQSALIKYEAPCSIIQMHQQLWQEKLLRLVIHVSRYKQLGCTLSLRYIFRIIWASGLICDTAASALTFFFLLLPKRCWLSNGSSKTDYKTNKCSARWMCNIISISAIQFHKANHFI